MASPKPSPDWEPIWRAIQPYVGFLQQLANRQQPGLAKLSTEDADDLLHEFCLGRLPRVLEHLERVPVHQREAYLTVAFRNFVRTHRRRAARYRAVLEAFAVSDREAPLEPRPAPIEGAGRPALSPLVGEFFSQGTSIRDLAKKFGVSRHAVRKAIVDGGLLLALSSAGQTELSRTELGVCRLVLLGHTSVAEAAATLGITETEAKRALASARGWISQQL